ncbi:MAG: ABC transporter permease [Armatimonadetes bacterium]|nr:ABC transporter permease [Armatimonadota bacterium]
MLIIAGLTIREALRRRIYLMAIVIGLIFWLLSLLPYYLHGSEMMRLHENDKVAIMVQMMIGMLKFFTSVVAIALAASTISGEIERGTLAIIMPKPISRMRVLMGKWLGLNVLLLISVIFWCALIWLSIFIQTHRSYPTIMRAGLAVTLYPVLFTSLTICFSTFATGALAAGLSLVLAGTAWADPVLGQLYLFTREHVFMTTSRIIGYLIPMTQMSLWVDRAIGPAVQSPFTSMQQQMIAYRYQLAGLNPPTATLSGLVYIFIYIVGTIVIAAFIFQRRDV